MARAAVFWLRLRTAAEDEAVGVFAANLRGSRAS
jgi:hypothetical protein